MPDQAEALRALARMRRQDQSTNILSRLTHNQQSSPLGHSGARVISVTSGKGGVGKTNLVCSLAVGLAKLGYQATILDADLGLANIDVILGLTPKYNLRHVISGQKRLDEIIAQGPAGIQVIPGASGIQAMADMGAEERSGFLSSFARLEGSTEFLLIDTGAGISSGVLDFVLAAAEIIVITTPEPTAVADAYAMIKVICNRGMAQKVKLVVNMAGSEKEAQTVSDHLARVVNRFLKTELDVLGSVVMDRHVTMSVRAQTPFIVQYPDCPAAASVMKICHRLSDNKSEKASGGVRGFFSRLFELPFGRGESTG